MLKRILRVASPGAVLAVMLSLAIPPQAVARNVVVAWDPNPLEENVVGYFVGYGTTTRTDPGFVEYKFREDVGNVTECTLDLPDSPAAFYVSVAAYNNLGLVSHYSKELATEAPVPHTVTSTAGTGGTIDPSGASEVVHGGAITFTVTPDPGYHVFDVEVDGTSVSAVSSYTLTNVTADHTITASFSALSHTLTASAGSGGTIRPSGSVAVSHGGSHSFAISASAGYEIAGVVVDGASVGAVSSYTFSTVTTDHTISASFAVLSHTVTASASAGGSISPSGSASISQGESAAFIITPAPGYEIADVEVDGASVGAVGSYTFSNVAADHTISASFEQDGSASVAGSIGSRSDVDRRWTTVTLSETYVHPVVIAGPPTNHNSVPGVVRINNVSSSSFEIRFRKWRYLRRRHQAAENVSYLVLESGRHEMSDGSIWEVGTFTHDGTGKWTAQSYTEPFATPPALFFTAQTAESRQPVTVRARNVTEAEFEAALFEEEALMNGHPRETIGYLAIYSPWLSGTVRLGAVEMPYLLQQVDVNQKFVPVGSFALALQEEQSRDSEMIHVDESVSVLLLDGELFAQITSYDGRDTVALRHLAPEYPETVEWGTVGHIDQTWRKVPLVKRYTNPIVVVKPASSAEEDPGVLRVQNVAGDSFEVRYQEWAYLTGVHAEEKIFYLVAEAGTQTVAGLTLEAGTLESAKLLQEGWEAVSFTSLFSGSPAVFTSVMTTNGDEPVTTRNRAVTPGEFQLTMQQEEAGTGSHPQETLGWIAIEKGVGTSVDHRTVLVMDGSTDDRPTAIAFGQSLNRRHPALIADMTTTDGSNPCTVRYQSLTPSAVTVKLQEEQSNDEETWHKTEEIVLFVAE